jgi:hypothetical protein
MKPQQRRAPAQAQRQHRTQQAAGRHIGQRQPLRAGGEEKADDEQRHEAQGHHQAMRHRRRHGPGQGPRRVTGDQHQRTTTGPGGQQHGRREEPQAMRCAEQARRRQGWDACGPAAVGGATARLMVFIDAVLVSIPGAAVDRTGLGHHRPKAGSCP